MITRDISGQTEYDWGSLATQGNHQENKITLLERNRLLLNEAMKKPSQKLQPPSGLCQRAVEEVKLLKDQVTSSVPDVTGQSLEQAMESESVVQSKHQL